MQRRSPAIPPISVLAISSLLAAAGLSCGGHGTGAPTNLGSASPVADQVLVQHQDLADGLELRLSSGRQGAPAFDRAALAPAKRLSDADAGALLSRATPITKDRDDARSFALRPGSTPAPRTGDTIKTAFPAPASSLLPPAASEAGKDLQVVRFMPEGKVPLAPELSVTFSQPMIAVTSQDDASATTPVKLSPPTKGKWRWIGTRTILFDPEVRFPQATTYSVEIPAGTRSANGGALKAAKKFTFETPPPSIVASFPASGPQRLDVPMFVRFDQRIDPSKILPYLKVTANGVAHKLRMLDAAELARHKQLAAFVAQTGADARGVAAGQDGEASSDAVATPGSPANPIANDGRWLAFRPIDALPADAAISVELSAGAPSAEGGNLTPSPQTYTFRTYPPLKIEEATCGWGSECRPGMPFVIRFNNPLDDARFAETQLTIEPAITDVQIVAQGNALVVQGATTPRTHYRVVVAGSVVDEFAQALGKDAARTFEVGAAQPSFFGPSGLVVLDPAAKRPTLDVFSTNYAQLSVKLYQVTPADYDRFATYMRTQWNHDKPPRMPGVERFADRIKIAGTADRMTETSVDLAAALAKSGLGHAIAVVEPSPWTDSHPPPRLIAWVQATRLAVDAHVDHDELLAFVTELDTGKPASGVALELRPSGTTATTDGKGLAKLPLAAAGPAGMHYLVARRGDDVAFVTDDRGWWNEHGSWNKIARPHALAWYVTDDRKLYRPGEEVSLKGWLRVLDPGKHGDLAGIAGQVASVSYKLFDARGNQLLTGSAPVSPVGGFDTRLALPRTPNLGSARLVFEARGAMAGSHVHFLQIGEFRRPEFEVSAQASQGPLVVGGAGDVTVNAKYFAGGPLSGADVQWQVTASQTSFTPPNRDDYVFGVWRPWWSYRGWFDDDLGRGRGRRGPATWSLAARTDATGAHVLRLDAVAVKPALPMAVMASAAVTDVNRQALSASAALIVHPSTLYVGLKTRRPFVDKGKPFELDVIGVDLDGKAAIGTPIEVKAVRLDWEYKRGKYTSKEVEAQTCSVIAAAAAKPCAFATPKGGEYQVTATIVDPRGRPNQTKLTFWVGGGDRPPARDVSREQVQLIPDKKDYTPGNTAELLIQAPFYPAEGVVTWRRSGIVATERITLDGPTQVITVPIADAMVPNLTVQVDLVGMAARLDEHGAPDPKLPKRPAYAVGTIDLPVPARQRTLAVTVTPNAGKLGPGEHAQLAVTVVDAAGRPVADAEAAVIVVDEAVLSLTGYQFVNPIDVFYARRGADTRDYYQRGYVKLAKPSADQLADTSEAMGLGVTKSAVMRGAAPGAAAPPSPAPAEVKMKTMSRSDLNAEAAATLPEGLVAGGPANQAIAVRTNFNPLAAFSPSVRTDAAGKAVVTVKLPDNLTRYRVVAIAVAGERQFGKGESAVTARLPLMVRPSPPRFLNFGDVFQLPVVVQNQTDVAMTVRVAVRTTNARLTAGAGREVVVPANERVEVQFPAAAELAGTARFQVVGTARHGQGTASDAAELALPVWTPATTEAFATYGVIDQGAIKQPVALPGKVVVELGGLEVTTASTNLQAVTDALLYLVHYPFECAEQRSSRILAIAALKDVLGAFQTKDLPTVSAMAASVTTDVERLSQMQNADGGFAYWDRGYPSQPYLTVYVANALGHARAKGFAVKPEVIEQAKGYLRMIESRYPGYYSQEVRWAISAYALYTRKQLGELDVGKARQLVAEAGVAKLTMEANGWLLATLAQQAGAAEERKAIVRHALNKVSETAGAANFTTGYGDGNYLLLSSDRRVDAVMLDALIQEQKDLDLIPKLVTGLLGHRKAGRWLNTQENTYALLALDRYFQVYEKATPSFVARVWLGNDYAGEHAFRGRTTETHAIGIAMTDVAAHDQRGQNVLTIQKEGAGRLYYRVGMTYAPASLALAAADHGFVVERKYEGVDARGDVTRGADGTWRIKAGARVRVRLTMVNENRRYHVALVDPLPAGLEAMNPALATTGPIPSDPSEQKARGAYWWWYGPWYEHQNLRDERVEAFASLLWAGVHTYSYVARATTPGSFVVPPTKAQEMYMPETFGRSASDRVVIE
jgi:alpha-2-macroglobulin